MASRRGILACVLLATACTAEPQGRGTAPAAGGADGKADDAAGFDPSLSEHQNEVTACREAAAKDRAGEDPLDAEIQLLRCVTRANDAVWPEVQAILPESVPDEFTGELLATKGDEVERYVERLRASQELVCGVFGTLEGENDEERSELVFTRCLAEAEIHTANLIDAHFDLDGRRLELVSSVQRFGRCEDRFEEEYGDGPEEVEGPPIPGEDDAEDEALWLTALHYDRRDCMKAEDAEFRVGWATDLSAFEAHRDAGFADRLRIVTRSVERESRASRLLCRLLAYQDEESTALTEALCMADSTLQAGQLYDSLRVEPEVDPTTGDAPDEEPDEEPPPMPPSEDGQACYPGPDGNWDVCLPVVYPATPPEGYGYPSALNGSANYRPPIGFIDLDAVDESTQIARDFTLAEVAHRWKGRYVVVQPHAVASLQRLRDDVGSITVNSGYRSPKYNDGVGGATHSRHMFGDGFDMDPNAVSLSTLEDACQNNGGFLVEYTSHVHCDFRFNDVDTTFFGE